MKYLLVLLVLSAGIPQVAGQTRAELDSRYAPVENNRYRVRPGIAAEVTFSENDKVKTIRIVSDDPKDKDALLRAKDVRELVRELIPGRMCRSPLSISKIVVSCPPRKACQGFKEEWKRATTLMVWYGDSVAYNLITLKDVLAPPPGNMKLLPGYEHEPSCGIDTAGGYIKKVGGIEIHYDIGLQAGNFARRYLNPDLAEWIRTEKVGDDSILIVLTKQKRIIATYEKDVANFTAQVTSKSDIDDFLKMVLTYSPPKRN